MNTTTANAVDIVALQQQPNFLDQMAALHQQEWQGNGRKVSLQGRRERLQSHLRTTGLPNTWLALHNNELVGSVSLIDYVFHSAHEPSAWVANLYVTPTWRGRGLGRRLLAFAEARGPQFRLQRLFLFTPNLRDFYQQSGWHFLHKARVQGQWVDVMMKWLPTHSTVEPIPAPRKRTNPRYSGHFSPVPQTVQVGW